MPSASPNPPLEVLRSPKAPRICTNAGRHDAPGPRLEVHSPYDGALLGQVPDSDAAEVARVVRHAASAAPVWGAVPLKERSAPLYRFREALLKHLDALSHSAARESGKTLDEARAGVLKGVEVVEYALSLQNLLVGGSQEVSRGVRCEVRREPLGVVAGITPFNFPAMVPMWMFPIAVTLGNAFVLKPSEKVPLTAAMLSDLMHDAGYPDGVFSLVHGGAPAASALVAHPDVSALAFVGSSPVARQVYADGAAAGKRVLALGGAKNTMILLPDADPALAVAGIVASFTGCAGQRCMAGSLLLAVGPCDALLEQVVEAAARIRLGRDMGALIDAASRTRLHEAVARGLSEGARLRLDGRGAAAPAACEAGHWLGPTVLDDVAPGSFCARTELFGPVLGVVRVPTLEDALALEAESPYGNAVSVFTQSGAAARLVETRAQSGMVGINVGVPVPREPFSFGGTKASRFGHGDITGASGVAFWTREKKVTSRWGAGGDGSWMS